MLFEVIEKLDKKQSEKNNAFDHQQQVFMAIINDTKSKMDQNQNVNKRLFNKYDDDINELRGLQGELDAVRRHILLLEQTKLDESVH